MKISKRKRIGKAAMDITATFFIASGVAKWTMTSIVHFLVSYGVMEGCFFATYLTNCFYGWLFLIIGASIFLLREMINGRGE